MTTTSKVGLILKETYRYIYIYIYVYINRKTAAVHIYIYFNINICIYMYIYKHVCTIIFIKKTPFYMYKEIISFEKFVKVLTLVLPAGDLGVGLRGPFWTHVYVLLSMLSTYPIYIENICIYLFTYMFIYIWLCI
jgi:hypothetical protein